MYRVAARSAVRVNSLARILCNRDHFFYGDTTLRVHSRGLLADFLYLIRSLGVVTRIIDTNGREGMGGIVALSS
jgi:hypothetical protein